MTDILISVFTPTYNRAGLIHRVYDSLQQQDFRNFEWIIVDDGSTDDTSEILEGFRKTAVFPFKVHRQTNRGKVAAINRGLNMAQGELFICFDSDDWCTPDAFTVIAKQWNALGPEGRTAYCGISCLKVLPDKSLVGEDYTRMRPLGETYVDRFNRRIKGDKWEILRTDLHREALYDLVPGERYMAPEYAWLKMGRTHKTVFLNEALSIVEYQAGGISLNNLAHRASSPVSAMRFYQLACNVSDNWSTRLRSVINLVRFAYHAQRPSGLPPVMKMIAAAPGWFLYHKDLRALNEQRHQGAK